jgi:putative oxidoreductase
MSKFLTPPSLSPRASFGLLLVRVVAGAGMLLHGLGKLQSDKGASSWMEGMGGPEILQSMAPIVPFAEVLGGALIVLGLVTPLAALLVLGTMSGALWFHISKGDPFVGGYELAALHLAIAALVLVAGPGAFSVDKGLFKSRG